MEVEENRDRRNKSIRWAVWTSLMSKGGFALLQLVAVPLAVRVLGMESFGLYASIAFAIQLVMMFQFGVGPALTHGISTAVANGDREAEQKYYASSFYLLLALTVLAGIVCSAIVLVVPMPAIFGEGYIGKEAEMMPAVWLAILFILIKLILSQTERAREGYLEVKFNNAWGACGNLLGALMLGIGIFYFKSISFILIAVNGPNLFMMFLNTIHLLAKRSYLIPKWGRFDLGIAKQLLKDGVAFGTTDMVPILVSTSGCSMIAAHIGGPAAVGMFHIMMQIVHHLKGFVVMFTLPAWPAVADAFARKDLAWVRNTSKRLLGFVAGYGMLVVIGFTVLGTFVLPLVYGPEVQPNRVLLFVVALFFTVSAWSYAVKSMLVGVGEVKHCARVVVVEALILLGPAFVGMKLLGLVGLVGSMVVTTLAVSGWMLPKRLFGKLDAEEWGADADPEFAERQLGHLGERDVGFVGRMRKRLHR